MRKRKSKLKTPQEKPVNSIAPETDTNHKPEQATPLAISGVQISPSPEDENYPCQCHECKTPWWKKPKNYIEVVAVLAAVFYAGITYKMWKDNGVQFDTANRPWLTLQNVTVGKTLGDGPMQQWIAGTNGGSVNVWGYSYDIQNYGHLPADDVIASGVILQHAPRSIAHTWLSRAVCVDALPPNTTTQVWWYDPQAPKDVVFPNVPIHKESGAMSIEPWALPGEGYGARYLALCVLYVDPATGKTHHTKLLYHGTATEWRATTLNGFTYYPIESIELIGTAAD